jgi:transcriptional regulator with XRE-family HTH domain
MSNQEVNLDKLVAMMKVKKGERGLRSIAREIGNISPSTLSRIERGDLPDLDTFVRLCRWLGVSTEEFLGIKEQTQSTPEIIEAHLRADRTLDPKTATALARIVYAAYDLLKQDESKAR